MAIRSEFLRMLAIVLAGFLAACCETRSPNVPRVPIIDAADFLKTNLAGQPPVMKGNPEGRTVSVICPPKGSEPVRFRGGEGLFQVLGNATILEDSTSRKWTNIAVIRPFPRGIKRDGRRSPVYVILVDANALFGIDMNMDENIPIWLGDKIVVPADGENVEDKLATEFGYRLYSVRPEELDRFAQPAPAPRIE